MESRSNKSIRHEPSQSFFNPYPIVLFEDANLKTVEELINTIFPVQSNEREFDREKDKLRAIENTTLQHIAYGLQDIKNYNPVTTPGTVKSRIKDIVKNQPDLKPATEFFLKHFEVATRFHGIKETKSSVTNEFARSSPRNSRTPLSFHLMQKPRKLECESIAYDIRLWNMSNFMHFYNNSVHQGTPISELKINRLLSSSNKLSSFISSDLAAAQVDNERFRNKIKIYLAVVQKLISKDTPMDFHGAGSIVMAFMRYEEAITTAKLGTRKKKAIRELIELFKFTGNYLELRKQMNNGNCIPPYWVISRDLAMSTENQYLLDQVELIGRQYLFLSRMAKDINTELKKVERNVLSYIFQTDFINILNGFCLIYSPTLPVQKTLDNYYLFYTPKILIRTNDGLYFLDRDKKDMDYLQIKINQNDLEKFDLNLFPKLYNKYSWLLTAKNMEFLHTINMMEQLKPVQTEKPVTNKTNEIPVPRIKPTLPRRASMESTRIHHKPGFPMLSPSRSSFMLSPKIEPKKPQTKKLQKTEAKVWDSSSLPKESEKSDESLQLKFSKKNEDASYKALVQNNHFIPPQSRRKKRHSEPQPVKPDDKELALESSIGSDLSPKKHSRF